MKPILISSVAIWLLMSSGCNRQSAEVAKKLAELEHQNSAATARQQELEQQLDDQKLAAARDVIERDRAQLEADREDLERQQGAAAADQDWALRQRAQDLAKREGKLEQAQATLEDKQDDLHLQSQQLSDRDRELAGREALPSVQPEPAPAPRQQAGDFGTFFDALSPYGSWLETADYGYVWQPVVVREVNWRPYARGRWVCCDRGWNWVSEEPFGWATYHYGRWCLLRGRGWVWVPGCEWAPCWVSWRQNDHHIGWAPLPPETMAYRGHSWDSTVDAQFRIGALCYNFVEIGNFGGALFSHCLPVAGNLTIINQTTNITYIHFQHGQVICGGPGYKTVCQLVGKPLPYYRLEVDKHPRKGNEPLGSRPHIQGDRLVVAAPDMDAGWNAGLKPKRVQGRLENITVERDGELSNEVTNRFRQSREEANKTADESIATLGGREKFTAQHGGQLREIRRQPETPVTTPPATIPVINNGPHVTPPPPELSVRPPSNDRPPETPVVRRNLVTGDQAHVTPPPPGIVRPNVERGQHVTPPPPEMVRPRVAEGQHVAPPAPLQPVDNADKVGQQRRQEEQARQAQLLAQQREAAQAQAAQKAADQQREQARRQQQEQQRAAEQARQAQVAAMEQQRQRQQQQPAPRQPDNPRQRNKDKDKDPNQ